MPEPEFEELGDGFKVTIFRKVSNASEKVSNASKTAKIIEKVNGLGAGRYKFIEL